MVRRTFGSGTWRLFILVIIMLTGVLLVGSAGVATWKYTNSNHYGTDDSNFCANSGCHNREWPGLVFD